MQIAGWFLTLALTVSSGAPASEPRSQDQPPPQRLVLDPDTNEWVPASEPAPAEVGPLKQARELLARGDWRAARRVLKSWLKGDLSTEQYAEAELLLAETYFQEQDFYAAYEHFELVVENATGELFYHALEREMDVARAFLAGRPRILWKIFRLPAYDDGVEILGRIWERVPGTRLGEDALKMRADFEFERGNLGVAQDEYANLAREYPNGRYAAYALLRAAAAGEGSYPGARFDDRSLLLAEQRYRQTQENFPADARRQHVSVRLDGIREQRAEKDFEIARWYERTRQTGAAIFYYRLVLSDWPGTLAETHASARLEALGAQPLERGGQPEPAEPETRPISDTEGGG